ncbi:unnamed protein product [Diamesa hyperborea]
MARNYIEDQTNEIEALESIYCGELEIIETANCYRKFKIPISTEEYNETQDGLFGYLIFTLKETYPDIAPVVEIEDENFENDVKTKILEQLDQTIEENLGMEMCFSLVSVAQEQLNIIFDEMKLKREQLKEAELLKKELEERKRFEGTIVTVESFLNWRNEFEIEFGIAEKKEKALMIGKLTGRELFTQDNSLLDSDIRFLLDNGDSIESVKIDESLFQNLDLEIGDDEGDDDSDDSDYDPSKDN